MLTEIFLNMIKSVFMVFINLMPTFDSLTIPAQVFDIFLDIFNTVAYFLPIGTMLTIFVSWVVLTNTTIAWKLLQRVWDALPFT